MIRFDRHKERGQPEAICFIPLDFDDALLLQRLAEQCESGDGVTWDVTNRILTIQPHYNPDKWRDLLEERRLYEPSEATDEP